MTYQKSPTYLDEAEAAVLSKGIKGDWDVDETMAKAKQARQEAQRKWHIHIMLGYASFFLMLYELACKYKRCLAIRDPTLKWDEMRQCGSYLLAVTAYAYIRYLQKWNDFLVRIMLMFFSGQYTSNILAYGIVIALLPLVAIGLLWKPLLTYHTCVYTLQTYLYLQF